MKIIKARYGKFFPIKKKKKIEKKKTKYNKDYIDLLNIN